MNFDFDFLHRRWDESKLTRLSPRARRILQISLASSVLGVALFDAWLGTCAFDGCPSSAEIQRFRPDEGGRILDRNGRMLGHLAYIRRVNVPLSAVPLSVKQAFVATEDRRFFDHRGTDWRGFIRAMFSNVRHGGVRQGFSTITMQAARNTFAVRKFQARSLPQKLIELRISRLLEHTLTKNQILELYLNAIYLGNGVYGVEAASRDLFGKSVSQLTVPQAAILAALPKAPSVYTPRRHPQRALDRRNLVLGLMAKEKYLSPAEARAYENVPLRISPDEWRPMGDMDSYALDAVRAFTDSVMREGEADVVDLTVYTTLDYRAQRIADIAVQRRAADIGRGVQGAMVALDPRNGDLRAIVGGRYYEKGNFNRAFSAKRQPGSAFKPFVYTAALQAGYTPASEVDDDPVSVVRGRNVWTPANYNGTYLGRITFRKALMVSANAATVRISRVVGEQSIIQVAHNNGITSQIDPQPAIALGAVDVTPIELVRAYAPFANGGFRITPRLVRRMESSDGSVLWSGESAPLERVLDPRDAYQMNSMLRSVVEYGTGRVIRDYGARGPIGGKTGTTNNGDDVWFIGFTPTVVAGFWFGYDNPRPVADAASGARLAAPAWADFYINGWREPGNEVAWAPPPGMSMRVIDATNGYLATEWCPVREQEYFKPGTEPTTPCPEHGPGAEEGYYSDQNPPSQNAWPEDMAKKIGKALGKIFKF